MKITSNHDRSWNGVAHCASAAKRGLDKNFHLPNRKRRAAEAEQTQSRLTGIGFTRDRRAKRRRALSNDPRPPQRRSG